VRCGDYRYLYRRQSTFKGGTLGNGCK
jgi:hypothetical protein